MADAGIVCHRCRRSMPARRSLLVRWLMICSYGAVARACQWRLWKRSYCCLRNLACCLWQWVSEMRHAGPVVDRRPRRRHRLTASAMECRTVGAGKVEGRCLCGSVVFQYDATPNWTVHCHCESCRRATSSPMTTWVSVPRSAFVLVKGVPRYYRSSPGVRRGFCENCGSPLTYENERIADEVHLYAASLADPAGQVPDRHVRVSEQLPWLEVLDELPRYANGSGAGAAPTHVGPKRR
jgi:hypothetical protein